MALPTGLSNHQSITAIETEYRGYRFRSRLEARWAVFFDALGLQWEYEPEGFNLPNGTRYLPDFRVTSPQGQVTWYEIKPRNSKSVSKMSQLEEAWYTHGLESEPDQYLSFITLAGDPWDVLLDKGWLICPRCGQVNDHSFFEGWSEEHSAFGCNSCDFNHTTGPSILLQTEFHKGLTLVLNTSLISYRLKLKQLATTARSARFEHGERPQRHRFQFGTLE